MKETRNGEMTSLKKGQELKKVQTNRKRNRITDLCTDRMDKIHVHPGIIRIATSLLTDLPDLTGPTGLSTTVLSTMTDVETIKEINQKEAVGVIPRGMTMTSGEIRITASSATAPIREAGATEAI